MQKLKYLPLLILLASACSTPDELPSGSAIVIGEVAQPGIGAKFNSTNYFFDQVVNEGPALVSVVAIDLNEDGVDDLLFELGSSLNSDEQALTVRAINETSIIAQDLQYDKIPSAPNFLSLAENGSLLQAETYHWVNDQALFILHRDGDEVASTGNVIREIAYLPFQIGEQLGWAEFQLLTDTSALNVWGINIRGVALTGI